MTEDKVEKKEKAIIRLSEFVNNTFSAMLMMKDELQSLQASLLFQMESWDKQKDAWSKRIDAIEDIRKAQLLATDAQIKKIDDMETQGFSLTDKTFVPHILGTVQIIHEELAKQSKCMEQIQVGQMAIDDRLTSLEMVSKVHFATQDEKMKKMANQFTELIAFDKKNIGNLIKLLLLSLIIIAAFAGVGALFDVLRSGL